MLDPSHPITASGDAVEEPKPFVPVFVVANDVRAIDSAIQDVIDASRNLNAETSRQGVIPKRCERLVESAYSLSISADTQIISKLFCVLFVHDSTACRNRVC